MAKLIKKTKKMINKKLLKEWGLEPDKKPK